MRFSSLLLFFVFCFFAFLLGLPKQFVDSVFKVAVYIKLLLISLEDVGGQAHCPGFVFVSFWGVFFGKNSSPIQGNEIFFFFLLTLSHLSILMTNLLLLHMVENERQECEETASKRRKLRRL